MSWRSRCLLAALLLVGSWLLVAPPRRAEKRLGVAVFPFRAAGDSHLPLGFALVLQDALARVPPMQPRPMRQVLRLMKERRLRVGDPVGDAHAAEVARALGAGVAITGEVESKGGTVRVVCRLIRVDPGGKSTEFALERKPDSGESVLSLVGDLPGEVVGRLGLRPAARQREQMRCVTHGTQSPEAFRFYVQAWEKRASTRLDAGKAVPLLEKAVAADPGWVMARAALARALMDAGWQQQYRQEDGAPLFRRAVKAARKAVDAAPDCAAAQSALSTACRMAAPEGDAGTSGSGESLRAARRAARLDPNDPGAHLMLWHLAGAPATGSGARSLRRSLELDPYQAWAHATVADAHARAGRIDEAVREFREANRLDPEDPFVLAGLGYALAAQGKLDEAMDAYRKEQALDPSLPSIETGIGGVLLRKGKVAEAAAVYRRGVKSHPSDAQLLAALGSALCRQGKLDEAERCYSRAIALRPKLAAAHAGLGYVFACRPKLDQALAAYGRAVEISPRDTYALGGMADVLHRQGKSDEAIGLLEKVLALRPDDADALLRIGTCMDEKGRHWSARRYYQRAVAADPKNAYAHYGLARLTMGSDPARAVEEARLARDLARRDPRAKDVVRHSDEILHSLGKP